MSHNSLSTFWNNAEFMTLLVYRHAGTDAGFAHARVRDLVEFLTRMLQQFKFPSMLCDFG